MQKPGYSLKKVAYSIILLVTLYRLIMGVDYTCYLQSRDSQKRLTEGRNISSEDIAQGFQVYIIDISDLLK